MPKQLGFSVLLATLIAAIWVLNAVPFLETIESNSSGATRACPVRT
jgi:hypothetical protein